MRGEWGGGQSDNVTEAGGFGTCGIHSELQEGLDTMGQPCRQSEQA